MFYITGYIFIIHYVKYILNVNIKLISLSLATSIQSVLPPVHLSICCRWPVFNLKSSTTGVDSIKSVHEVTLIHRREFNPVATSTGIIGIVPLSPFVVRTVLEDECM
jgi:hypothetical protein